MCEVCTEAVHSVALWTRTSSRDWTDMPCVHSVRKQSISVALCRHRFGHARSMYRSSPFPCGERFHYFHNPYIYGPTEIFRLHFSGALFADSTTLKLARAPYQPGAKNNNLQISSTMAIYAYPHASLEETRVLRFYNVLHRMINLQYPWIRWNIKVLKYFSAGWA